jgi:hypothetical protein
MQLWQGVHIVVGSKVAASTDEGEMLLTGVNNGARLQAYQRSPKLCSLEPMSPCDASVSF